MKQLALKGSLEFSDIIKQNSEFSRFDSATITIKNSRRICQNGVVKSVATKPLMHLLSTQGTQE